MKKILSYLKDYQKKNFDWKLYLAFILFLAVIIFCNYHFNLRSKIVENYHYKPTFLVVNFLFYGILFLCGCIILHIFNIKRSFLKNPCFWLKFFLAFGLFALGGSYNSLFNLRAFVHDAAYPYIFKTFYWLSRLIFIVLPLVILYPLLEKDHPKIWYGLKWINFDTKPYLILLMIAAIFVTIGSFFSELSTYYPQYPSEYVELLRSEFTNIPSWLLVCVFEFCYGLSFISVELFFRGFLIYGFIRIFGDYAVLPMVVVYASIHFNKPLLETISSVFGGYVLGVISLRSRNIWGGIFVHLGVAWIMELAGWMQNLND